MLKFIAIFMVGACTLSAQPNVERVYFDSHCFLKFSETAYLHDPDCGCQDRWGAIIRDPETNAELIVDILRYPASHWD